MGALNAGAPTNPWKEVVLRLETMPRMLVKLIYNSIKLAIFASIISLILLFVAKMVRTPDDACTAWVGCGLLASYIVVPTTRWLFCKHMDTYTHVHTQNTQVDPNFGFYDMWFTWVQMSFAGVSMVVALGIWTEFVVRLVSVRRKRLTWCVAKPIRHTHC